MDDYIITLIHETGQVFIWHKGLEEPYEFDIATRRCSCPSFIYRKYCKHSDIVREKGWWNRELG